MDEDKPSVPPDYPDTEPEFSIDTEALPLIPENEYILGYENYETYQYFNTPKIKVNFTVLDEGKYYGTRLSLFYRVEKLTGPTGKYGRFQPRGMNSDFVRDWIKLFGRPKRNDRLSLHRLKSVLIKANVSTVTHDSKKRPLSVDSRYSCISELISAQKV